MSYQTTYQIIAKRVIQITMSFILALLAVIAYHQLMSTMSMDSMADHQVSPVSCSTLCFIAVKIDVIELVQMLYYSFIHSSGAVLLALIISIRVLFFGSSAQWLSHSISRIVQYVRSRHRQFILYDYITLAFQSRRAAHLLYD